MDLSLDDKISEQKRSMLAVWDFPITDKYNHFQKNQKDKDSSEVPQSLDEALVRVRNSSLSEGFALIG